MNLLTPIFRLGEVADLKDSLHQTPQYLSEGYPMVRVTDIRRGFLNLSSTLKVSDETYAAFVKRYSPQEGDIIFSRVGSYGNSAFVDRPVKFCLGQNTVCISPRRNLVEPFYLYSCLNAPAMRNQIDLLVGGASQPTISLKSISALQVPVPEVSIQRRISRILYQYDCLIENNTQRIKILEQMAQMLYREWFVNFRFLGHEKFKMVESVMGLIPEGWAEAKFTDLADVLSGGTPKTTEPLFWDGEIPFFGPVDAPGGYFVVDTKKSITPLGLSRCNSKLYPEETVFITARGTVGKVALPSVPMAMNQSCYALRPKNGLGKLFLFMMTKDCTERLQQKATGAVFDAITVDTFDRLEVIRPPEVLTLNFDATVRPMFAMMLNLEVKIKNLRTTRDLLLPKLVSGEVSVETLEEGALAETV